MNTAELQKKRTEEMTQGGQDMVPLSIQDASHFQEVFLPPQVEQTGVIAQHENQAITTLIELSNQQPTTEITADAALHLPTQGKVVLPETPPNDTTPHDSIWGRIWFFRRAKEKGELKNAA